MYNAFFWGRSRSLLRAFPFRIAYVKRCFFFFLIAFITKKYGQLKIAYAKKFAILLQCALIFETAL